MHIYVRRTSTLAYSEAYSIWLGALKLCYLNSGGQREYLKHEDVIHLCQAQLQSLVGSKVRLITDVENYHARQPRAYLLQRYSTEWQEFIDVLGVIEIDDKDHLPIPAMSLIINLNWNYYVAVCGIIGKIGNACTHVQTVRAIVTWLYRSCESHYTSKSCASRRTWCTSS